MQDSGRVNPQPLAPYMAQIKNELDADLRAKSEYYNIDLAQERPFVAKDDKPLRFLWETVELHAPANENSGMPARAGFAPAAAELAHVLGPAGRRAPQPAQCVTAVPVRPLAQLKWGTLQRNGNAGQQREAGMTYKEKLIRDLKAKKN